MQDSTEHKPKSKISTIDKIYSLLKWFFSVDGAVITLTLLVIGSILAYVIQDAIQRQRYLELLEFEIRSNEIKANTMINTYNKDGLLYIPFSQFNTEVYNSGLQSGYILTIDPGIQSQLLGLYVDYLPNVNKLISSEEDVIKRSQQKWEDCLINSSISTNNQKDVCKQEKQQLDNAQKIISGSVVNDYKQASQNLSKINFNPTQERLHSPLKYLMGSQSLKVQQ